MQGGGYTPTPGFGLTTSAPTQDEMSTTVPSQGRPVDVEGDRSEMSHLDSFFAESGWTREDVLVVAAVVQLGMWMALLYLEVSE